MHAPESFVDKLDAEFRGRLRIRWSAQRSEWRIEQKIKRGLFPGTRPTRRGWDESSDAYVENRDGVVFILAVRTGDRMPCPRCGHELKVPFLQTSHLKCAYCTLMGRQTFVAAVHMPLGDILINHLKSIDPENPISERLNEDLDRQNAAMVATQERDALRDGDQAMTERYNRMVGIPEFGYAGKTSMWVNAPASPKGTF